VTLDIAVNKVEKLENIDHLPHLEELWMNWNNLADTEENREYLRKLKLKTIYLADNPMSQDDTYQEMLQERIPTLTQIDGNALGRGLKFYHQRTVGIHSVMKQQMNPEAKKILQEVVDAHPEKTEEAEEKKQQ
jgi:hypothetical protein